MKRIDAAMGKTREKLPPPMTWDQMEVFEAWFENLSEEERNDYAQKIEQAYVAATTHQNPALDQFEAGAAMMSKSKITSLWHTTDFFSRKRVRHERIDEKIWWGLKIYRYLKGKFLLVRIWIEKKTRPTVDKVSWFLVKKLQPDAYYNTPVASPRWRKRIFAPRLNFRSDASFKEAVGHAISPINPSISNEEYQRRIETLLLAAEESEEDPSASEVLQAAQMQTPGPVDTPEQTIARLTAFAHEFQERGR